MRIRLFPITFAATVALVAGLAGGAGAQMCGDPDGSGSITVSDGVQCLAAAAEPQSSCTAATCDADASGSIGVTDCVNILRAAASLSATLNCGGGTTNPSVERLVGDLQPFLSIGLGFVPLGGAQAAQETADCDNVGEGFIEADGDTIILDNCELSGFLFDGAIVVGQSSIEFDFLDITDLTTGEVIGFDGVLTFTQSGSSAIVGGTLNVFSDEFGDFTLSFNALTINNQGFLTSGSLTLDVLDGDIDGITGLTLGFNGSALIDVTVSLADGSTQQFVFDSNTGQLTPA